MHHGHHWTLGLFLHSENIVHEVWILQCVDKVTIGWCPRNLQTSVLRLSHGLVIHGFAIQAVTDEIVLPFTDGTLDDTIRSATMTKLEETKHALKIGLTKDSKKSRFCNFLRTTWMDTSGYHQENLQCHYTTSWQSPNMFPNEATPEGLLFPAQSLQTC